MTEKYDPSVKINPNLNLSYIPYYRDRILIIDDSGS